MSLQAVLLRATTAGTVRPVPLAVAPGIAVNSRAAAGRTQVAVGSADGYPVIWRKAARGSWTLVSSLPLAGVSADDGATWAQADLRAASADSSS